MPKDATQQYNATLKVKKNSFINNITDGFAVFISPSTLLVTYPLRKAFTSIVHTIHSPLQFRSYFRLASMGAGATAGALVGAALGAALGSIVPGIGNVVGGAIGAYIGAGLSGAIAKQMSRGLSYLWYRSSKEFKHLPSNPARFKYIPRGDELDIAQTKQTDAAKAIIHAKKSLGWMRHIPFTQAYRKNAYFNRLLSDIGQDKVASLELAPDTVLESEIAATPGTYGNGSEKSRASIRRDALDWQGSSNKNITFFGNTVLFAEQPAVVDDESDPTTKFSDHFSALIPTN